MKNRFLRWVFAPLALSLALVGVNATPALAAVSGTTTAPVLSSPNGSDFTWSCTINPDGTTQYVVGRWWLDPLNGTVATNEVDPALPVQDGRNVISGIEPVTLNYSSDGAENSPYRGRCLTFATSTTQTYTWRTPEHWSIITGIDNDPPVAVLEQPAEVEEGVSTTLTAVNSTDPDDGISSYDWDFGDGTTSTGHAWHFVDHAYAEPGSYDVTVTVRDLGGLTDTDTKTIVVTETPRALDVGASSNRPGTTGKLASMKALDDDLATAAGLPLTTPVADFWHVYNGATMPTSWNTSNGAASVANGWNSMTNIKWESGEIRTDAGRAKFLGFLESIPPPPFKVYLIGGHEPENDPLAGDAVWRQNWILDQAEFIKLVVDFDPTGEHVIPMSVFMGDPPRSWGLFNFFPHLRPGDIDKMICGFDAYPKARAATDTQPERTDDPGFKYDPVANWYRAQGCTRLAIAETTLNNNAMVSQALVDHWWQVKFPGWLDANEDVVAVALYDASGPAAGTNGFIDEPGELKAASDLMLAA